MSRAPMRSRSAAASALPWLLLCLLLHPGCAWMGDWKAAIRRGDTALRLGDPAEAARAYREALEARPGNPAAELGLARAYVASGDPEAALEIFAVLSQAAPRSFQTGRDVYQQALDDAARLRAERGDPAGGLRYLRRLAELNPGRAGLSERLRASAVAQGDRLLLEGRPAAARALFEEVLEASPGHLDATLGLARCLLEVGSVDEAIRILTDASVRHPGDPRVDSLIERAIEIRYPSAPAKLAP